jgi:hypothetical protein
LPALQFAEVVGVQLTVMGEVAVGRPKSEAWKRAMSERMKQVEEHPEEHGLPACHRRTEDEIALLGTDHDTKIAE